MRTGGGKGLEEEWMWWLLLGLMIISPCSLTHSLTHLRLMGGDCVISSWNRSASPPSLRNVSDGWTDSRALCYLHTHSPGFSDGGRSNQPTASGFGHELIEWGLIEWGLIERGLIDGDRWLVGCLLGFCWMNEWMNWDSTFDDAVWQRTICFA